MKIDDNSLKAYYQAHVGAKKPLPGTACPSTEKLLGLLRSQLSRREATGIVDHISACSDCATEFQFLSEVLREESALIRDIGEWLAKRREAERESPRDQRIFSFRRSLKVFSPRLSWRAVSFLAGVAVVAVAVLSFLVFRAPDEFRSDGRERITLLQPVEKSMAKPHLHFKWQDVKEAEYYILEVYDETLLPVWKSERIAENSAVLPDAVVQKLPSERSYFWMVTAYFAGSEKITSPLEKFTLKE